MGTDLPSRRSGRGASASDGCARIPAAVAPITPVAPPAGAGPLFTQSWLDLAFIHWAVEPAEVADLLPAGTLPDTHEGLTYVGLVPFRMHRAGVLNLPGLPYVGSFPETNLRLYSVDARGRRGVVFRSLDATRLVPVALGRTLFGLPYRWSAMRIDRAGGAVRYTSRTRLSGGRTVRSRIAVRPGEPVREPSPLEHFLTARWGLHSVFFGRTRYLANAHPPWPLYRAELTECEEGLTAAAGLRTPLGEPVSVLFSPGVRARFMAPGRLGR